MTGRLARWIAALQGAYFAGTGLWPIFHMASFLAVTGPKTDLWLVRTVGLLVATIGATLLLAAWRSRLSPELLLLAATSAITLAAIDCIHVLLDVISPIYLLDAVAELVVVAAWLGAWLRERRSRSGTTPPT